MIFSIKSGRSGGRGWELDYKKDRAGYALSGLKQPLTLGKGVYRMSFMVRRGHYPNEGILRQTYEFVPAGNLGQAKQQHYQVTNPSK